MARPLRVLVPDGWYHVFGRGWDRRAIFEDERDREHFVDLLEGLHERYRFRIHAYVLMGNHHHLLLQTPEANLSRGMQWFNTSYAAWFNARHSRVGTLWQGRFRDVLVENGEWAYELSTYLHLNPLRIAGLGLDKKGRVLEGGGFRKPTREQVTQRLARLRKYPWSSYRAYGGYCTPPTWLTMEELWRRSHKEPAKQRSAYRAELQKRLTYGVDPSTSERLRDVIAIGSASFSRRVRESVGEGIEGLENKRALRRRASAAEVRTVVEECRGQPWDEFAGRRGDWGRAVFLWAVRKRCGLTLREAGQAADGMTPWAVDTAIRRLKARASRDRELRAIQAEIMARLDKTRDES
jgi:REP element-mobilizing transposase RayT